jgi:hypothetical protein
MGRYNTEEKKNTTSGQPDREDMRIKMLLFIVKWAGSY